jgi:hypothetical protein
MSIGHWGISHSQELSPDEFLGFSDKQEAMDALKKLKEYPILREQVDAYGEESGDKDEKIKLLEQKVDLLNERIALRDEKIQLQADYIKFKDGMIADYKELLAVKEKEVKRARLTGIIIGVTGTIIAILALIVAM